MAVLGRDERKKNKIVKFNEFLQQLFFWLYKLFYKKQLVSDLKATHSQVVFITGISCKTKDSEWDWGWSQTGQCQLPFAWVSLFQESRQLKDCYLPDKKWRKSQVETF